MYLKCILQSCVGLAFLQIPLSGQELVSLQRHVHLLKWGVFCVDINNFRGGHIMDHFQIFYDSLTEALWFANLNPFFDFNSPQNQYIQIGRRGNNPRIIEQLTSYDKPDIILLKNNVPVLTIEKTQEVPTGHNVGQRFARLVKSIELDVPVIYFFPFDAKKHGLNMINIALQ